MDKTDFTKINVDTNGNPRYVIHYLACCPYAWNEHNISKYEKVVKLMNKIGGRKYHTKKYGGGIVFQTYSLYTTIHQIEEIKRNTK